MDLGMMSYAQNLEDIIEICLEAARNGEDSVDLESDYDLSETDICYIQGEVNRRL